MLNKNQSNKRNSWKYAIILPVLIGFIFLFQVKVIAQQKQESVVNKQMHPGDNVRIVVDKNSSDAEIKKDAANLKKEHGITLKYSKVKRNSAGEITGIKMEFKDKEGNKGVSQVNGNEPIKPIHFYKNDSGIGFGKSKSMKIFTNTSGGFTEVAPIDINIDDSIDVVGNFDLDLDLDLDLPEPPEVPEIPEAAEAIKAFSWSGSVKGDNDIVIKNVVIKKDGDKKAKVIVNGKVLSDKEIEEAVQKYGGKGFSVISDGESHQITINGQNVMKASSRAMADARIQMKKMRPQIEKQMGMMRTNKGKMKADIARAKAEINAAKPDMEAAKAEMVKAKEEMIKAKAEMDAAKAEYEKAKAELKK